MSFIKSAKSAYVFQILPIIECIGQLNIVYKDNNGPWKLKTQGTGTVFYVDNKKQAFVLTCAHNVYHKVNQCKKCKKYVRRVQRVVRKKIITKLSFLQT